MIQIQVYVMDFYIRLIIVKGDFKVIKYNNVFTLALTQVKRVIR